MKNFLVAVSFLMFASTSYSQKGEDLELPSERTIPSYTVWVSNALEKYGRDERNMGSVKETTKLKNIVFRNCAVSLVESVVRTRPDPTVRFGERTTSVAPVELPTHYVFDFGQMDADSVRLTPSVKKNMLDLRFKASSGASVIHFVASPHSASQRSGIGSTFSVSIQKEAASAVSDGIRTLIALCTPVQSK